MITHAQLERFRSLSPRWKVGVIVGTLLIIAAFIYGVFSLGHAIADARFDKKRQTLEAEIESRKRNEAQLAGENALLKKQNEMAAELLDSADKKRGADAAKIFTDLANERAKQYENIDTDTDFDSQLCGLCDDARRAGHALSDSFCGRCKAGSQDHR